MGYGAYSHAAHIAMTQARRSKSSREVFSQTRCHDLMNPKGAGYRESRDSEAHPLSLGVVFALDVSGSMGEIPAHLATHTLPAFMKALLDAGVADSQVLFMAVGHAVSDSAPLQVGQFESSAALMDQWLTRMYLEGGGAGGNESYELAMYFGARHTKMDCWERRGRRGYFFITGDEPPNSHVSRLQVKALIGDDLPNDIPIAAVIEELQQTFEPFYLIPEPGRARGIEREWRALLGDRVVVMASPDDTSHVAAALVALLEAAEPDLPAVIERLRGAGLPQQRAAAIAQAVAPFAASLGRDGAPAPALGVAKLDGAGRPSGLDR